MPTRLLIVGGVAGGASAAARARRLNEDAEIIIFEKGKYISFANCGLPYYIGSEIREREDLLVTSPKTLEDRFNINVKTECEVIEIDRKNSEVVVKDVNTGKTCREKYDKLILSPGAVPVKPPIPGIDLETVFTLRSIPDTDKIYQFVNVEKPESAVIIGGGFIGLEMAENLASRGIHVFIVEMLNQALAPLDYEMASIIHQHLKDNSIDLRLNEKVNSIKIENEKTIITTSKGEIKTDMVIMSVGVKPNVDLAKKAGLSIGKTGGILTDEYMQTSDPDIYAVGDAVEIKDFITGSPTLVPLASPASKQARIAADNVMGRKSKYRGVQGTSIVKVFDMVAAATGANEKTLKSKGIKYLASYNHAGSHASYYPGSQMMSIKVVFSPEDGRILGAQAVGMKGVDKRIDVLSTAIRAKMTVYDLEELELAYAPPFSSVRDPVNMAGFVASNMLRGDLETINWNETECINKDEYEFLDVRTPEETGSTGVFNGGINIPIDSLRKRINELDKSKKYITVCASGLRSYVASRMMKQRGFEVKNLSGGYRTFRYPKSDLEGKTCPNIQAKPEEKPMSKKVINVNEIKPNVVINASGLQCPGPIMKLKETIDKMNDGEILKITATDPGFKTDAGGWCNSTCNRLLSIKSEKGAITAIIAKGRETLEEAAACKTPDKKTIIVFSNDLDRALASFIIANGAASMGSDVTMFFTFWGLNVLRKKKGKRVKKDFLSTMFGAMMPKGPDKLHLSKLNMAGMGTEMMKYVMKSKNVDSLDVLIEKAKKQGVHLIACTMTLDIMGLKMEELIDGVEEGGVGYYLDNANNSNVNLFI